MNDTSSSPAPASPAAFAAGCIDHAQLLQGWRELQRGGVLLADVFAQSWQRAAWVLRNGRLHSGEARTEQGVGLRCVGEGCSALVNGADLDPASFEAALRGAQEALRSFPRRHRSPHSPRGVIHVAPGPASRPTVLDPPDARLAPEQVQAWLVGIEDGLRREIPGVLDVELALRHEECRTLLVSPQGQPVAERRRYTWLELELVATGRPDPVAVFRTLGWRAGSPTPQAAALATFLSAFCEAVAQQREARPAPAGPLPLVLGPGGPGLLMHEVIGHALEGDALHKGISPFSGQLGRRIAAPCVQLVDDGTRAGAWGSLQCDDEGQPSRTTVLIENGRLRGGLHDQTSAMRMGVPHSANARRASAASLPQPRMTNTCLLPGHADPGEILASVQHGVYIAELAGGQANISTGTFTFESDQAFLIEHGRITAPLLGCTFTGTSREVLRNVRLVGSDFAMDPGYGTCVKKGQRLHVGFGQPTVRVDGLTVGGR
ncbi:TldD/PmbA family protein [Mitsuaria sp. WAJ17]|uniref:TldD/PmbA family protein n=1 Tax=Mitsuaria sp. WAJ17 TaxID=2761452 RepID=UPI001600B415|nr:TldD/PmbA family protein [Mitsuaria sp. WAJ17]MBB2484696.1 TldD/PmbA family protein [Mitsuaria sp. WAJ17]